MNRKCIRGLVVVLAVIVAMSTFALAAEKAAKAVPSQTIMGTIETLDAAKGALTLKKDGDDGKSMYMRAKKKLLAGLKVHDHVKVEMVGKKVKAIEKTM